MRQNKPQLDYTSGLTALCSVAFWMTSVFTGMGLRLLLPDSFDGLPLLLILVGAMALACLTNRTLARSFARIYYRNCFNEGLAIIICPEAVDAIEAGEEVTIDFDNFIITTAKGQKIPFPHYPEFVQGLIADGGLIPHVKKELGLA